MKWNDIPKFTSYGSYAIDVPWNYLNEHIQNWVLDYDLELNPDFQRGHVWDTDRKEAYIRFCLKGGTSANNVYFNCPGWQSLGETGQMVCVDGLQRITSVLDFMNDRLRVFGFLKSEFEGRFPAMAYKLRFHVNDLDTRAKVLNWYLEMNSGGVVHSKEELNRVRNMLLKEENE